MTITTKHCLMLFYLHTLACGSLQPSLSPNRRMIFWFSIHVCLAAWLWWMSPESCIVGYSHLLVAFRNSCGACCQLCINQRYNGLLLGVCHTALQRPFITLWQFMVMASWLCSTQPRLWVLFPITYLHCPLTQHYTFQHMHSWIFTYAHANTLTRLFP